MSDGFRFPVDRTTILNFAGALGETNRVYWDEEWARATGVGGVIAPPTFTAAAAHWNPSNVFKGVKRIPAPPAAGARPEGAGRGAGGGANVARVLHGEMRFEYHKPIRPGMTLTASGRPGRSWDKEGKRGGRMRFSESVTEFRDERGELVVTATSVGIVTEKAVE
jgi:acyl dehydratase